MNKEDGQKCSTLLIMGVSLPVHNPSDKRTCLYDVPDSVVVHAFSEVAKLEGELSS